MECQSNNVQQEKFTQKQRATTNNIRYLGLPYLRLSPSTLFRRYTFRFHTCAFHRSGFSAGTLPAFIPALFSIYSFPQVHCPLSYLRFSPFRFSAGTLSSFIPALLTVSTFPQVRFPLSYLRFSPSRFFRRYSFRFHTCASHRSGFSAGISLGILPLSQGVILCHVI